MLQCHYERQEIRDQIKNSTCRKTLLLYGNDVSCARSPLARGTQRQFLENICSENDLRSRIFGTFVVKFLACPPLLGFSNPPQKNDIIAHF